MFEIMRQQEEIRLTEQAVEKALFKAMEVEADIVGNRLFFSFCLKSFFSFNTTYFFVVDLVHELQISWMFLVYSYLGHFLSWFTLI